MIWHLIEGAWLRLASVKVTLVVLLALLLLAIPGTVVLQYNISNVDPGIQYDYDFWRFGQMTQLFSAYHSFWYSALIAVLAMNLIACSVERWPQMLKLATAKPVAWARETFSHHPKHLSHEWNSPLDKRAAKSHLIKMLRAAWYKPVVVEEDEEGFQLAWQTGRWSRIANYLVHTSLLLVFAGAIVSALYGFEGAANIPAGQAIDTFILFKEGKASGLERVPGGLVNERLLGFRLEAEKFQVNFYEDFPGRPKDFISQLNILDHGRMAKSAEIRVNRPMKYKNFVFYQSSYGRMGDYNVRARIVDKDHPLDNPLSFKTTLGEVKKFDGSPLQIVALQGFMNVQGLGPAVQFQEVKDNRPFGAPFWVLKNYPRFDLERRHGAYGVILEDLEELYFTGLQISYDPGAPIYWTGCFGMLIGTFWALFITHRKFQLRYRKGHLTLAGSINRLPIGFQQNVAEWAARLSQATAAAT